MTLKKQREAFLDGFIEKPDYIKDMYEKHHAHLFDYQEYLVQTDIKSIEITDQGVLFTTRKHDIKLFSSKSDYRMAPLEILNFQYYEPGETEMMLRLMPKGARVFDIGGNAGWNAVLFAKNDSTAKVFSFEPVPSSWDLMCRNIAVNKCKNVEVFNFGLSNSTEVIKFYFYPEGSGNASAAKLSDRESQIELDCQVRKIDDVISDISDSLDFIKCDVEGAELMVFQGAGETITKYKPMVFTEMLRKWSTKYGYHPNDIIDFFSDKGYGCYVISDGGLKEFSRVDENTLETNYFFLNKEKHRKEILDFVKS